MYRKMELMKDFIFDPQIVGGGAKIRNLKFFLSNESDYNSHEVSEEDYIKAFSSRDSLAKMIEIFHTEKLYDVVENISIRKEWTSWALNYMMLSFGSHMIVIRTAMGQISGNVLAFQWGNKIYRIHDKDEVHIL